jgi:hypothetical protein
MRHAEGLAWRGAAYASVKVGLAPKRVGEGAVLERQKAGFRAHFARGTALVRRALLCEDAHVLAAASGVSWTYGKAGVGRVARLRRGGIEGLGGIGLAMSIANNCDAVVEVIHAIVAGIILVPAAAASFKSPIVI